jgi:hypothetical protein
MEIGRSDPYSERSCPYQGHSFIVVDCNQFFVTLQLKDSPNLMGFALRQVDISYDYKMIDQ